MIENGNITGYKIAAKETFVTFCGMVGLQAMVLGRLGWSPPPLIQGRVLYPAHRSPFTGRGGLSRVKPPARTSLLKPAAGQQVQPPHNGQGAYHR